MFDGITVASIASTAGPFVTGLLSVVLLVIAYKVTLRRAGYVISKFGQ